MIILWLSDWVISLFSPHHFKRNDDIILSYISKMNKSNSIEAIEKAKLTEQTKFRLNEIIILMKRLIEENHPVKN